LGLQLTGVKDEDVIDDSLFAISFSASEDDEVLSELGAGVAVPGGWGLTHGLAGINLMAILDKMRHLDHLP
jgi:hypothetical protein